jgi:hypothetical protein
MATEKIKVLHISGYGGSGTTLIGNAFAQVKGLLHVGQLTDLWYGIEIKRKCGCGVPFVECEFWTKVFEEAFGGLDKVDIPRMMSLHERTRSRNAHLLLRRSQDDTLRAHAEEYLDTLQKLYRAIDKVAGCEMIVDTSKDTLHDYLLMLIPDIDLYVAHLVRDSRGVGYSRLKRKKPMVQGWLTWNIFNWSLEKFGKRFPERYVRFRYEDFVDDPKAALERVLAITPKKDPDFSFIKGREVVYDTVHTIGGNRMRQQTGPVMLRKDEEWRKKLRSPLKTMGTMMTLPYLRRYGYLDRSPQSE